MPANLENSAVATGLRTGKGQFSFQSQRKEMAKNIQTTHNCTHLTRWQSNAQNSPRKASTILKLRTSRCSSWFWKRQRNQRSNCQHLWIIEKAREFQKNIYFCFIDYVKAFDCVDHSKLWKILKEMGIPDHLTCLLRNLYAGQEATVRTGHRTTNWFQIGKRSTSRLYIVTLLI